MTERPCGHHITIAIWALGIMTTALAMTATSVIDNRNRAVAEEREITDDLTTAKMVAAQQHADMMATWQKQNQEVLQRLSRIEVLVTK